MLFNRSGPITITGNALALGALSVAMPSDLIGVKVRLLRFDSRYRRDQDA